jgi:hypothetical protein
VNALNNPEVGKFINDNFVSSFQKVGTFRIVNGQKQGGNVAAYFCAPDGRVLHSVAGPVNGDQMLREAKWVVDSVKRAITESKGEGAKFKTLFRQWHAERLRQEFGLIVEPVTFDAPVPQDANDALTYRDPRGTPIVPILPPPPIEGPDVSFRRELAASKAADESAMPAMHDRKGGRWALPNQGRVHQLMAAHCMTKIENVYGTVFENILGERISTRPVEMIGAGAQNQREVCLHCAAVAARADK